MQGWFLAEGFSGFSPRWVPESARWLLTQGRVEEARTYLFRCAKLNGQPVSEDSLSQEVRVTMDIRECPGVGV